MAETRGSRWEVGSEFHWEPADHDPSEPWAAPAPAVRYATGTGALRALLSLLGPGRTVHLPTYFCQDVVDALARDAPVGRYTELPDGRGPDPGSLTAGRRDVVVRANLFGRARDRPRDGWLPPGVTLVEDHTHDPLSAWAAGSTADYCVASLRKTLPLPDGALLWSPAGRRLPTGPRTVEPAAGDKLRAMYLKAAWLRGASDDRDTYRALQTAAEETICSGVTAMSPFSAGALRRLAVHRMRERRIRNADRLAGHLRDVAGVQLLPDPPAGQAPFGVQVVLPDRDARDRLRARLHDRRIYAAVHWPQPVGPASAAADLASRIVTVPVDQRYTTADVDRVAAAVAQPLRA